MSEFKKGDKVTMFQNWCETGTIYYTHATVVSCGKKQMTLECATTGEMLGRHFTPTNYCYHNFRSNIGNGLTFKRMSDEEATEKALEFAQEFINEKTKEYTKRIESTDDVSDKEYYQKVIDKLQPEALSRSEVLERVEQMLNA